MLRPQLPYPIARQQIARVVFAHSVRQIGLALLNPSLAFFLLSLTGQLATNQYQAGLGLASLAALALGWLPLLPLLAWTTIVRHNAGRILIVPIGVTMIVSTSLRAEWGASILTLPGLNLVAITTTATFLLLRWQITRHYETCDLTTEFGSAHPFENTMLMRGIGR